MSLSIAICKESKVSSSGLQKALLASVKVFYSCREMVTFHWRQSCVGPNSVVPDLNMAACSRLIQNGQRFVSAEDGYLSDSSQSHDTMLEWFLSGCGV